MLLTTLRTMQETTFACMSVHLRVWALESVPAAVLCTHVSTLLLVQTTREGPAMQAVSRCSQHALQGP